MENIHPDASSGYRFVVFGDQRALADGEWQEILRRIATLGEKDERLLFMLDTGDIVNDGSHSDQFAMLREILAPCSALPYLVGVGNHETKNNETDQARENTALFLRDLDPAFSASRMYYRKEIGPVRFLFLDTNDLLYGDRGERSRIDHLEEGSRGAAQVEWLLRELGGSSPSEEVTTVVVMHHPLVQSSKKHRGQAVSLWNSSFEGRSLADILLDGGVDIILSGHTHTFERFRIRRREDGAEMTLVNVSGRPREPLLTWGHSPRRARDIRGREASWLHDQGWSDIGRWQIVQEDPMIGRGANQFCLFTVDSEGHVLMETHFLDDRYPDGIRQDGPVRLK